MIKDHIYSSFEVSRVEVFEEEDIDLEEISLGRIPKECFNMDIDTPISPESLFVFVEEAYACMDFTCSRRGDRVRKNPDGSVLLHLEVESAIARSLVVMVYQDKFFSLTTFPMSVRPV